MMMITKYLGPTTHRGARVRVTLPDGQKHTVAWDHALDAPQMHASAAAERMWCGTWVMSSLPDDAGYAFTMVRFGQRRRIVNSYGAQVWPQKRVRS